MDDFDIIALTETWLEENFGDRELQLDGYNIFRRDRRGRGGVGVAHSVLLQKL